MSEWKMFFKYSAIAIAGILFIKHGSLNVFQIWDIGLKVLIALIVVLIIIIPQRVLSKKLCKEIESVSIIYNDGDSSSIIKCIEEQKEIDSLKWIFNKIKKHSFEKEFNRMEYSLKTTLKDDVLNIYKSIDKDNWIFFESEIDGEKIVSYIVLKPEEIETLKVWINRHCGDMKWFETKE